MPGSVSDKDNGFAALFKRLGQTKPVVLTVGIQAEEASNPDGSGKTTIGEIATINEFGIGVPERSFIRAWADENEPKNLEVLRKIGESVVTGKGPTPDQGLNQAGLRFVGDIQARISAGIGPPNAASTIARKGSSVPLIDTGQLRSSIRHKVEK